MTTNQYAVTEFSHSVDPRKPDALPGVFFKYDLEALSVHVTQSRRGIVQFLTRTFGVVGGINYYITNVKYLIFILILISFS